MEEVKKTECVICGKEIEVLEDFNGETMCQGCYHEEENHVFEGDVDEE